MVSCKLASGHSPFFHGISSKRASRSPVTWQKFMCRCKGKGMEIKSYHMWKTGQECLGNLRKLFCDMLERRYHLNHFACKFHWVVPAERKGLQEPWVSNLVFQKKDCFITWWKHRKKTLKILRFKLQGAQLTSNDDSPGSQISQSSLIYSGQRWMDPLAMGF